MIAPGTRLGPYEIVGQIGVGGMGIVYRARDPRLERDLAIKVLATEQSDALARERFVREARAASSLNHPHIVTIYDVGEADGIGSYFAMELVLGRTLREIAHGGPISPSRALALAIQIADALAAAHAHGIVHRDLKPENVIVKSDETVKILDFGLARTPAEARTMRSLATTQAGTILGTPGYMAPEQARGEVANFAADQFALGAILYELLSGRRAFSKSSAIETAAAAITDEPPSIRELCPKSARRSFEESLETWRGIGDLTAQARALSNLGSIDALENRPDEAIARYEECRAMFDQAGDDVGATWSLVHEGDVRRGQHQLAVARRLYSEALERFQRLDYHWGVTGAHEALGHVAREERRSADAQRHFSEALAAARQHGDLRGVSRILEATSLLFGESGDARRALMLAGAAASLRETIGAPQSRIERDTLDISLRAFRTGPHARDAARSWMEGSALSINDAIACASAAEIHDERRVRQERRESE